MTYHIKLRTKLFLGLMSFLVFFACSSKDNTEVVDLTRFLSKYQSSNANITDTSAISQDKFIGVSGSARLIVTTSGGVTGVNVHLNGSEVVGSGNNITAGKLEVPVTLVKDNVVSVTVNGAPESSATIRVKQEAQITMYVKSRMHFNTNVSDYEASSKFYEKLGFGTMMGFPDSNTQAMARAMGVETPTSYDGSKGGEVGSYLLHGQLKSLSIMTWGGDAMKGGIIDLIEFMIPGNDEPPYAKLNHLGIAKATMYTRDIAADYEYMKGIGVKFISAPVTRSDGTTFAIFSDLDGTFYELTQKERDDKKIKTTHIFTLGPITINVSDFERSSAWYQMMGYKVFKELPSTDSLEVAKAMGFDEKYKIKGAILKREKDGSMIELVQWITPHNPEPPYGMPINHLGIARTAFGTGDMEADVAVLKAQGVKFVSDITPCCSGPDSPGSIVAFFDPDGTIIELAEQGIVSQVSMFWNWKKDQIFK
ncbi:MAG: hypothetical protein HN379_11140 [Desulfobacteraceae bacterium]|nr:hypothetical protein [Desulfobacteraceae bacterium]